MQTVKIIGFVLGGVVTTIALAVVVFWVGWLTPPDAHEVCDNVDRIIKDELRGTPATVRRACMKAANTEPGIGRAIWIKRLKCMRDAADRAGLAACDRIKSL